MIAVLISGAYRFIQGGTGVWAGIAIIVSSGLLGIVWRHKRLRVLHTITLSELYVFGLVVHMVMLACMLTIPWPLSLEILSNISFPVLLMYPIVTVLLGKLLIVRLANNKNREALQESESY